MCETLAGFLLAKTNFVFSTSSNMSVVIMLSWDKRFLYLNDFHLTRMGIGFYLIRTGGSIEYGFHLIRIGIFFFYGFHLIRTRDSYNTTFT